MSVCVCMRARALTVDEGAPGTLVGGNMGNKPGEPWVPSLMSPRALELGPPAALAGRRRPPTPRAGREVNRNLEWPGRSARTGTTCYLTLGGWELGRLGQQSRRGGLRVWGPEFREAGT